MKSPKCISVHSRRAEHVRERFERKNRRDTPGYNVATPTEEESTGLLFRDYVSVQFVVTIMTQ